MSALKRLIKKADDNPRTNGSFVLAATAELERLETALNHIAAQPCESFLSPANCWNSGRKLGATDGADAVCNPCVARKAVQE